MSQETPCKTPGPHAASGWPEDLESEGTVVKRYRFGGRQAFVLSLAAIFSIVLVNMMSARDQIDETPGWLESHHNSPSLETHDGAFGEPIAGSQASKNVWKKAGADPVSRVQDFLAKARRTIEHKAVNMAFAGLDPNDSRQARAFLAAYGSNQYAQEQGYPQAVTRRILEERLYGKDEIVDCGACWCWESKPAHAGPAHLTD